MESSILEQDKPLIIVNDTDNYIKIVFSSSESKYYMTNFSTKFFSIDTKVVVSIFTILNSKTCLIHEQEIITPCTIKITDDHINLARREGF